MAGQRKWKEAAAFKAIDAVVARAQTVARARLILNTSGSERSPSQNTVLRKPNNLGMHLLPFSVTADTNPRSGLDLSTAMLCRLSTASLKVKTPSLSYHVISLINQCQSRWWYLNISLLHITNMKTGWKPFD